MNETMPVEFEEWIRQRRAALGLTQTELARLVHCAVDTIRKIERGERRPGRELAQLLAVSLRIEPRDQDHFVKVARGERAAHSLVAPVPDHGILTPPALPVHHTRLIGRADELATLAHVLRDPTARLLTLIGPGGVGKTRLAIRAADEHLTAFADGVVFVPLTARRSAEFLPAAIAEALHISFHSQADPKVQLLNHLQSKAMLIVLDNYEHLLPDVDVLVELLQYTRARCLVTSRARLNIEGEWVFEVRGLPFPDDDQLEESRDFSAVQLFLHSAQRLQLGFAPAVQDEPQIVRICQLVEGLPLAIELAASWVHVMACQEIAQEIARSLAFLTASRREVAVRHRSMAVVFQHSWDLLSADEQRVFCQLSVFRGGFQRDAAEQVAGASLVLLRSLIDKSLLRHNGSSRYDMHELVRQFAAEKLHERGEVAHTQRTHLAYYLTFVEAAEPKLTSAERWHWLEQLEREHDNLRVAMRWAIADDQSADAGLRLVGGLTWFWYHMDHWQESRYWLEHLLAEKRVAVSTEARAKALRAIAFLNWYQGQYAIAYTQAEQSVALWRAVGNQRDLAFALISFGMAALFSNDTAGASAHLTESVTIWRGLDDPWGLAFALSMLGYVPKILGETETAREQFEESVTLWRQTQDPWGLMFAVNNLGELALEQGRIGSATAYFQEGLTLAKQQQRNKEGMTWALHNLGYIALEHQNVEQATAYFTESLALCEELGITAQIPSELIGFAGLAIVANQLDRAVCLLGAVTAGTAPLGFLWPIDRHYYEQYHAALQEQLDPTIFAATWAAGYSMSMEEAVRYARG